MTSNYSWVGHAHGFKAKRGKAKEFADICEKLYFAESALKYLCLYDPEGKLDQAQAEVDSVLRKLESVSYPKKQSTEV